MHILIAQFNYSLTPEELEATAEQLAPNFAEIPGCIEKTWLHDAPSRTCGGVYKFRDGESVKTYLESELWKGVESTPQFTNLTTRVFAVIERASEITHGVKAEAVAR